MEIEGVGMNKAYNVGHCPICNSYGVMELIFDKTINKVIIMCDECSLEFSCVSDYQSNINGHREFVEKDKLQDLPIVRNATLDEIINTEWYPLVKI